MGLMVLWILFVGIELLQRDSPLFNACSHKCLQAQEKLGPVDMLVNCAGMSLSGKFEDLEVSTFEVSRHLIFCSVGRPHAGSRMRPQAKALPMTKIKCIQSE